MKNRFYLVMVIIYYLDSLASGFHAVPTFCHRIVNIFSASDDVKYDIQSVFEQHMSMLSKLVNYSRSEVFVQYYDDSYPRLVYAYPEMSVTQQNDYINPGTDASFESQKLSDVFSNDATNDEYIFSDLREEDIILPIVHKASVLGYLKIIFNDERDWVRNAEYVDILNFFCCGLGNILALEMQSLANENILVIAQLNSPMCLNLSHALSHLFVLSSTEKVFRRLAGYFKRNLHGKNYGENAVIEVSPSFYCYLLPDEFIRTAYCNDDVYGWSLRLRKDDEIGLESIQNILGWFCFTGSLLFAH